MKNASRNNQKRSPYVYGAQFASQNQYMNQMPQQLPQQMPQQISQQMSQQMSQQLPQQMPQQFPQQMPQQMPQQITQNSNVHFNPQPFHPPHQGNNIQSNLSSSSHNSLNSRPTHYGPQIHTSVNPYSGRNLITPETSHKLYTGNSHTNMPPQVHPQVSLQVPPYPSSNQPANWSNPTLTQAYQRGSHYGPASSEPPAWDSSTPLGVPNMPIPAIPLYPTATQSGTMPGSRYGNRNSYYKNTVGSITGSSSHYGPGEHIQNGKRQSVLVPSTGPNSKNVKRSTQPSVKPGAKIATAKPATTKIKSTVKPAAKSAVATSHAASGIFSQLAVAAGGTNKAIKPAATAPTSSTHVQPNLNPRVRSRGPATSARPGRAMTTAAAKNPQPIVSAEAATTTGTAIATATTAVTHSIVIPTISSETAPFLTPKAGVGITALTAVEASLAKLPLSPAKEVAVSIGISGKSDDSGSGSANDSRNSSSNSNGISKGDNTSYSSSSSSIGAKRKGTFLTDGIVSAANVVETLAGFQIKAHQQQKKNAAMIWSDFNENKIHFKSLENDSDVYMDQYLVYVSAIKVIQGDLTRDGKPKLKNPIQQFIRGELTSYLVNRNTSGDVISEVFTPYFEPGGKVDEKPSGAKKFKHSKLTRGQRKRQKKQKSAENAELLAAAALVPTGDAVSPPDISVNSVNTVNASSDSGVASTVIATSTDTTNPTTDISTDLSTAPAGTTSVTTLEA